MRISVLTAIYGVLGRLDVADTWLFRCVCLCEPFLLYPCYSLLFGSEFRKDIYVLLCFGYCLYK